MSTILYDFGLMAAECLDCGQLFFVYEMPDDESDGKYGTCLCLVESAKLIQKITEKNEEEKSDV